MNTPDGHSHLSQSTVFVTGGSGGLASRILQLFAERGCESSIHTASPKFDAPSPILCKVNIKGTRALLHFAQESGTQCFVYSSSASIISDAQTDLIHTDETFPVLLEQSQQPEVYRWRASNPFLTCAIRPSGIFGVGDLVVLPGILDAYFLGQTRWQIGENRNRLDFTENTNDDDDDKTKVDGEAFFITNDETRCFWDFTRLVWQFAWDTTRREQVWVIPRSWALGLDQPPLTGTRVRLSCMTRYFCIDTAKTRLGYRPVVRLEEGLKRAVKDCLSRRAAEDEGLKKRS
ncbi:NAD(P)-binding protein [Aspergillus uvarum CBS 121591]|uniref:NAD(P)-binding protein n=1 Tax=Aspergillus uvarum CBS 121591 TaxID=1448315 RepID=A0A319C1Q1_9EURO|nr:NAD(P)-binding protein [Aspergillus uvarum CBS 121591]PYH78995.1 NAD(P)-binding protein [Aspergillus uvarum CBS 121591]